MLMSLTLFKQIHNKIVHRRHHILNFIFGIALKVLGQASLSYLLFTENELQIVMMADFRSKHTKEMDNSNTLLVLFSFLGS